MYSTPPCPNLAASTAAYRRRSFSDSHPKNRCIFCSISAEYPSMPHSLIQNLLRGQDTTAQAIREVILDHILNSFLDVLGDSSSDLIRKNSLIRNFKLCHNDWPFKKLLWNFKFKF